MVELMNKGEGVSEEEIATQQIVEEVCARMKVSELGADLAGAAANTPLILGDRPDCSDINSHLALPAVGKPTGPLNPSSARCSRPRRLLPLDQDIRFLSHSSLSASVFCTFPVCVFLVTTFATFVGADLSGGRAAIDE